MAMTAQYYNKGADLSWEAIRPDRGTPGARLEQIGRHAHPVSLCHP